MRHIRWQGPALADLFVSSSKDSTTKSRSHQENKAKPLRSHQDWCPLLSSDKGQIMLSIPMALLRVLQVDFDPDLVRCGRSGPP